MKKIWGYARISTAQKQHIDRQIKTLTDYGVPEENIIYDKQSGKDFNREQYQILKKFVRENDEVIVSELDRLGRNKAMVKEELNYFKEHGVRVKVLNIPTTLIDIPEGQEWLMDMINNILIEVMGAIAQNEFEAIHRRQREGIAAAKARGQHMGRPKLKTPKLFEDYYKLVKENKITATKCIELLGISRGSYYILVKEYEAR